MNEWLCLIASCDGSPDTFEDEKVLPGLRTLDDLHLTERMRLAECFDLPRVEKPKGVVRHGFV